MRTEYSWLSGNIGSGLCPRLEDFRKAQGPEPAIPGRVNWRKSTGLALCVRVDADRRFVRALLNAGVRFKNGAKLFSNFGGGQHQLPQFSHWITKRLPSKIIRTAEILATYTVCETGRKAFPPPLFPVKFHLFFKYLSNQPSARSLARCKSAPLNPCPAPEIVSNSAGTPAAIRRSTIHNDCSYAT